MDTLQLALVPLGAFWLIFTSILSAAKFVNDMREIIVTGVIGETRLTLKHRKAMLFDWSLVMIGTVFASFLFSGLIFWLSSYLHAVSQNSGMYYAAGVVALFPFLGGIMFIACGISDFRLMRDTLRLEGNKSHEGEA